MSVQTKPTAVILMLCVATPGDLITARVKMDFVEMEEHVTVTMATSYVFFIYCNE